MHRNCVTEILWHRASNSVIGVSLPMEPNGLRNHKREVVTDIKSIIAVFEEIPRTTLVLVVMAPSLVNGIPPIRILSFTDNKFTAEDVKARMHSIITTLAAEGILSPVFFRRRSWPRNEIYAWNGRAGSPSSKKYAFSFFFQFMKFVF